MLIPTNIKQFNYTQYNSTHSSRCTINIKKLYFDEFLVNFFKIIVLFTY